MKDRYLHLQNQGERCTREQKELDPTDTAEHALEKLHSSSIRKVHICGRRGPEHAAFTSPELRELPKLEHTDVHIDLHQIHEAKTRAESLGEVPKDVTSNLDAMKLIAEAEKKGHARSMYFHFLSTPVEIREIREWKKLYLASTK